jgi:hypothetical protein
LERPVAGDVDQRPRAIAREDEHLERVLVSERPAALEVGAKRFLDLLGERRAARGGALLIGAEDLVIQLDRRSHAQKHTVWA